MGGTLVARTLAQTSCCLLALAAALAPAGAMASPVAPPVGSSSAGNPGTNVVLAVVGTVNVNSLPSLAPQRGPLRPAASTALSPGTAPTAPDQGAGTAAPVLPFAPTLANTLEQEVDFGGISEDGVAPPDTWVARGAGDVVESVNLAVAISTRSGAPIKSFSLNKFYVGVNPDPGLSDPRIEFDDSSSRWFTSIVTISANANSTKNSVLMAVSNTSDPTGTWTIYHVDGPLPTNRMADQPRLGFSSDKVDIAYEDFDQSHGCFPTSSCHDDILWVLQLSDLVAGGSVHATRFNTTSGLAHPFGIVPAIPLDGAETTTAYTTYNETHLGGHNAAVLVITGTPAAGTTAYNDIETGINNTNAPPPAHQPGGLQNIDTGDDRFLSASVSQATGGLGAVIWITLGDKCSVAGNDQACIRGLRVDVDSTGSTLTKTWEQNFGAAGSDQYYPAIVGDAAGDHAFLTYTISSPTEFPTSEVLSVFPSDSTQNQRMDYATGTQALTGCPCRTGTGLSRWGDYSGIWADDASGTSVWAATEFGAISGDSWATQVAEFTLDAPIVTSLSPSSGVAGTLVAVFGANFTPSSLVAFGGVPASPVTFAGSGELIVPAPPQAAGAVDVSVTTLKGTSPRNPPGDLYTYPAILWASLPAAHDVTMIDTSSDTLITAPLSLGAGTPGGIATLPDDSEALVVDTTNGLLVPITTPTRSLGPPAPTGPAPLDVAVRPDGAFAYVTNPTSITPIKMMAGGALQSLADQRARFGAPQRHRHHAGQRARLRDRPVEQQGVDHRPQEERRRSGLRLALHGLPDGDRRQRVGRLRHRRPRTFHARDRAQFLHLDQPHP